MLQNHMIIFFFLIFIGRLGAAADPNCISINCGGGAAPATGKWLRDAAPKGSSTTSTVKGDLITAVDPVPYKTARISLSQFSFSFQLSPGQKFLRLHFNPSSYNGFESFNDFFSVKAGHLSLLANFSASITARALAVNVLVKEFCIIVQENEALNLVFSPETSQWENSYAFVNGIEIISVPSTTPYCHGRDTTGVDVYVDNSTALERVHYQHIKWGPVSAGDDIAAMFGMWAEPTIKENAEMATNKTWRVSVDVGFKYLVRLHLCEVGLEMDFVLLINNRVSLTSADMLQQRGNRNLLWYNNYVVMVEGLKQEGKRDISISLHSHHEFLDRHGPLEGFEVFKLSNHDRTLASPSLVIPIQDSPSQTLLHSLRVLLYNPYGPISLLSYTILLHICTILIIVYLERNPFDPMSLLPYTKEDNKPSFMAKRLSPGFSLAAILGKISEYDRVDKGFVDYGREIVAINPLKIDSKQGEHEFRTVIETLWGLRHVNLLSLIGYCREQQEIVLVNEYIPSGTMADHLYKPTRKSNDVYQQSWKQRLQICIEVSQALEYLHTGPMIMHRDFKASNILLDENFVAKLADFGLAETGSFRKSQSQDSTDLIGTFGYIAPDFFTTGKLSEGSDVYSFGMVLLETLCGRRAAMKPRSEEDNRSLTTWDERTRVENVDYDRSQEENMNLVAPNEKINADNYVSRMESTDSSTGSQQPKMPPGFRFHPSDLELVTYYLKKKITSTRLHIDLYNCDPWDLPEVAATFREPAWYFFSLRDIKHLNRARPNWAATSRYWKTRGMHKQMMNSSESMQGFQEWQSYRAKISDFGLAKNCPTDSNSHATTQVMATYGYAAPEYIATGQLYAKSADVYSSGMVLLKMLTRMRAFDTISLDIAELAFTCLESEPKNRPSMQEVVDTLERIASSYLVIRQSIDAANNLCSAVSSEARGSPRIIFVY